MPKLNDFNPEDFVLEDIKVSDPKRTLLEYDAKNNLVLIRVSDGKNIKYKQIPLTTSLNEAILENIPDEWSNDKDKILVFAIYDDGEYILDKERLKYDFATQTTRWIRYEYKELTKKQATELYQVILSSCFVQQNLEQQKTDDALLELANREEYFNERYLEKEQEMVEMLRGSDYRILPDYPETYPEEKADWETWRNKLREIVKKPEDFDSYLDFHIYMDEFVWPIDPITYMDKYPNRDVPYLSTEDQYEESKLLAVEEYRKSISGSLSSAAKRIEEQKNNGKPISQEMYQIIEKYNLSANLENFNLSDYKIVEQ